MSYFKIIIPSTLEHNLEKYDAIKRSIYLTEAENLKGDYLEFGVFTGSSFVFAIKYCKKIRSSMKFHGYDSFNGFDNTDPEDEHPSYIDDNFSMDLKFKKRVMNYINKNSKGIHYTIHSGFFKDTIKDRSFNGKIRIVFIDCDMKESALLSLNYIKLGIQEGTIIILDDMFSYKGNRNKGVCGAFNMFKDKNTNISFRRLFDYGYGGSAYIVDSIS